MLLLMANKNSDPLQTFNKYAIKKINASNIEHSSIAQTKWDQNKHDYFWHWTTVCNIAKWNDLKNTYISEFGVYHSFDAIIFYIVTFVSQNECFCQPSAEMMLNYSITVNDSIKKAWNPILLWIFIDRDSHEWF